MGRSKHSKLGPKNKNSMSVQSMKIGCLMQMTKIVHLVRVIKTAQFSQMKDDTLDAEKNQIYLCT